MIDTIMIILDVASIVLSTVLIVLLTKSLKKK